MARQEKDPDLERIRQSIENDIALANISIAINVIAIVAIIAILFWRQ